MNNRVWVYAGFSFFICVLMLLASSGGQNSNLYGGTLAVLIVLAGFAFLADTNIQIGQAINAEPGKSIAKFVLRTAIYGGAIWFVYTKIVGSLETLGLDWRFSWIAVILLLSKTVPAIWDAYEVEGDREKIQKGADAIALASSGFLVFLYIVDRNNGIWGVVSTYKHKMIGHLPSVAKEFYSFAAGEMVDWKLAWIAIILVATYSYLAIRAAVKETDEEKIVAGTKWFAWTTSAVLFVFYLFGNLPSISTPAIGGFGKIGNSISNFFDPITSFLSGDRIDYRLAWIIFLVVISFLFQGAKKIYDNKKDGAKEGYVIILWTVGAILIFLYITDPKSSAFSIGNRAYGAVVGAKDWILYPKSVRNYRKAHAQGGAPQKNVRHMGHSGSGWRISWIGPSGPFVCSREGDILTWRYQRGAEDIMFAGEDSGGEIRGKGRWIHHSRVRAQGDFFMEGSHGWLDDELSGRRLRMELSQ